MKKNRCFFLPTTLITIITQLTHGKNFSSMIECSGRMACAQDTPSSSFPLSDFFSRFDQNMMYVDFQTDTTSKVNQYLILNTNTTLPCLPRQVFCAYLCQIDPSCISFRYKESIDTCDLFSSHPFKLKYEEKCQTFQIPKEVPTTFAAGSNVATFKKACQSSTYTTMAGYEMHAWNVVDGVNSSDSSKGLCCHSADSYSGPNWLMVDLELVVQIFKVSILTRTTSIASYLYRYNNQTIGLTNSSWLKWQPIRGQYPLCGYFTGVPQASTWLDIPCQNNSPPSRYVIVQQADLGTSGGHQCFCELLVFANPV